MKDKRVALVGLTYEVLRDFLQVPDGIQVVGMYDDFDRMCLVLKMVPKSDSVLWDALVTVKPGELIPISYIEFSNTNAGRYEFCVSFRWWVLIRLKVWRKRFYNWRSNKIVAFRYWLSSMTGKK
jgi:hypothetical protein